jgi:hypothetical protein
MSVVSAERDAGSQSAKFDNMNPIWKGRQPL